MAFGFFDATKGTPEEIMQKRAIARALMSKGDGGGIRTIGEGIGQGLSGIGEALIYRSLMDEASAAEKAGLEDWQTQFGSLLSGGDLLGSAATSGVAGELAATSPAVAGDMSTYRDAIASIESAGSGDYSAVGPTHPKLGRALGRYQIMEANIGPWSQAALGRAVTPEEFMADPKIQDAIFDSQFGQYVQKYGPEGAAQAWFGGPGGVGKLDRKDSLGTSIAAYTDKFNSAVGGQQVAALTPEAAIEAVAPGSGSVVPQEPQFDAGRFGDPINLAEMPPNAAQLPGSLVEQGANYAPPLPPPTNVESRPVASVAESLVQPPVEVAQAGGADYFPPAPQPPQQGRPSVAQLLAAANHPFAPKAAQGVIGALLEQEMKRNDPMTQLQLQKAQLELEALRNPQPKDTDDIREYNFAVSQGFDGSFNDFQLQNRRAGATNVTTNVGEGDKFYENLDKKNAETFATMSDAGIQARGKLAQIDRLDALLSQSPQGAEAGVKQWLGDMGIPSEGLDAIQATRALLEKMVPEQRPPGSGPMSDADIAMFRNSLPRVIGQPGGNQLILQSMRGVAEYEMQMGQIADMVADRAITPAEGRERIRNLKNPLEEYNKMVRDMGKTQKGGRIGEIEWSVD